MPGRDKGHKGQLSTLKGLPWEYHLHKMVREGCTKGITCGQRHKQREGVSHVKIWEKAYQEGVVTAMVLSQKYIWSVEETAGVSGREKNVFEG